MKNIEEVEKSLNIKFPDEYIKFIDDINKEHTSKEIMLLDDDENIIIKDFLYIDTDCENSVVQIYNEYRSLMLEGIIPIATTEYEDYICLYYDVDRETSPKVILWCYELAVEELGKGMFTIGNTFKEFIEKLDAK
ncbi:SMI1/KNR4 family protein [Clostridium saccharoperbutylacetonicum]|uniref:SMI1/KNR4 family protein n=1 Tax=Clostridium saccharoperbutylacetonicum TaxID=36745 RepID=UPI000983AB4B|nr:SMI1/KNR4 family protein [Clostridium saccharoperbutylacetonicum]AQR93148.1 SMI1 / KNR4 family protein [Clostridium saccharoperbutylacetonicum]NSB34563.1 hypothetical protein [Clostridium saccharoperbutylacetonicum]